MTGSIAFLRSPARTDPIGSALGVPRRVTVPMYRWPDCDLPRWWCVNGLLRTERKFQRLKGHRAMPTRL